ncbi:MAG: NAD-dependent epimerase/dehydratase family protein [Deltaproteobacteria bacterium]|nr:NAD-dependent epimerase/dehydratase family protein [Deltaproteobacteria bacterium]
MSAMRIEGHAFAVTGGAGFVGSHLVDALVARGALRVMVIDSQPDDARLRAALATGRVSVVTADVSERQAVGSALRDTHGIFHMATLPLNLCTTNPELAIAVNVAGTLNVILGGIDAGAQRIIYSSASSVYGDTREVMDETHPLMPNTLYGATKLAGEVLLTAYRSRIAWLTLRYMNVYGPRQSLGLVPAVMRKVAAGEPPVITGDGSASFDFVHVSDVVACNLLAMESDVTGDAFNVGSESEASVKEIAQEILRIAKSDLTPVYRTDAAPPARRVGSSKKAMRRLGYEPRVSLQAGLEETWRAFRQS